MSTRKFIKKLHLYAALIFCIPLILQGLTGAILVFQDEISHNSIKKNHVFAEGETRSAGAIIKAASAAVEKDFNLNSVKFSDVATVRFVKNEGEKKSLREVILDPVSLEVLEIKNPEKDFFRCLKKFHSSLYIKGELGHKIVSSFGFILLFLTISGMILWFPKAQNLRKPKAFTFKFKFSSTGKKFQRDLHVTFGFWTCVFLFITSLSGIYLSLPEGTYKALLAVLPSDKMLPINAMQVEEKYSAKVEINEAVRLAKLEAGEGMTLVALGFPAKANQPYRLNFAAENDREGTPTMVVLLDPYTSQIIAKRDPKTFKTGNKFVAWQHALHTGEWLGLPTKIINFILGFTLLLFSITGIMMWLIKKRKPQVVV
jgi:uncharacterized iron-regulated membrane protein